MSGELLPDGLVLVRVTDEFDEHTVPPGLLRDHRVARGVWGRLVVRSGSVGFVFDDDPNGGARLDEGDEMVIPPGRRHHVEIVGPCRFVVEFHGPADPPPID